MLEGVLASVLNRFLASYVDGLNTSQLNVGIWSGDVKLRNLRLKTSALDKFRLPIDVKEGYLGDLTLSIPWSNLKGKPVRVLVENVYLLAAPRNANVDADEAEEDERAQAAKQEKLANAELLGRDSSSSVSMSAEDAQKNESFTSSLITKIVDNLQITVRNIHIRYEDDLSNPEHPFSAGLTLAEFSAISTDKDWNPTFIQNSADGIHKLARLESLAAYWDTDTVSLAGYSIDEAQEKFKSLIAREGNVPSHQFILSPVSGAGRLTMRRKMTPDTPKVNAELLFDQLGFALDDEQYRDIISVTDLFHFFTRYAQYRRFRPSPQELEENRPRALLQFAEERSLMKFMRSTEFGAGTTSVRDEMIEKNMSAFSKRKIIKIRKSTKSKLPYSLQQAIVAQNWVNLNVDYPTKISASIVQLHAVNCAVNNCKSVRKKQKAVISLHDNKVVVVDGLVGFGEAIQTHMRMRMEC